MEKIPLLLTEDDEFSDAAETALKSIFDQFDLDKDGVLNDSEISGLRMFF